MKDYERFFRQGGESLRFYTPNPFLAFTKNSNLIFDGVYNSSQNIPRAIYHEEKKEPETLSEFDDISSINMLSTPFTYDRQDCVNDFRQEKYTSFRKWFFTTYNREEQQKYKTLFYNHIDCMKKLYSFPCWFITSRRVQDPTS